MDIDIFIRATKKNAEKTLAALKAFGYDVTDVNKEDLLKKKILIRQYAVETDIHPFVTGITFDRVWKNKVKAKLGNTYAYFASLTDLIRMKQAAARPKDVEDVKYLKKLRPRRRK